VFQSFLMTFAEHMDKRGYGRFGSDNNYGGYYDRNKWLSPTVKKSGVAFNSILVAMKFNQFVFWNQHRYMCKKNINPTVMSEKILRQLIVNLAGKLDYSALCDANTVQLSEDVMKKVVLETGDIEFYYYFSTRRGLVNNFSSLSEVNQIVSKMAKIGIKINGESQHGFRKLLEGLKTDIITTTNIDLYLKLYESIRTVKGYTTTTRARLIELLVHNTGDKETLDKLKKLLKKEKSKRVWTDFKQEILREYFPTENHYDYKTRISTRTLMKGKLSDLMKFIAEMEGTPQLAYSWKNDLPRLKEFLAQGNIQEKVKDDASNSATKIR